jgi:hypothetical protein
MAGDDVTLGIDQDRRVEPELRNAARYLSDLRVRATPGILGVWNELGELPMLDALLLCLRRHSSPSKWRFVVEARLSESALCARLSNRASASRFTSELPRLSIFMYKLRAARHYFRYLLGNAGNSQLMEKYTVTALPGVFVLPKSATHGRPRRHRIDSPSRTLFPT